MVHLAWAEVAGDVFHDNRTGKNGRHGIVGQLRQSVFGRLNGYEDVSDAERLGRDPAMQWVVGGKAVERPAASTSQMGRFETELLASDENFAALTALSRQWIDSVHDRGPPKMIILEMDFSVSLPHGDQESAAYKGHFGASATIRCSCSTTWTTWSGAACVPAKCTARRLVGCFGAGRGTLQGTERSSLFSRRCRVDFARSLRIPGIRRRAVRDLPTRQQGLPGGHLSPAPSPLNHICRYHTSFSYQAGSWARARRMVAKVEWYPGELCPLVGSSFTP